MNIHAKTIIPWRKKASRMQPTIDTWSVLSETCANFAEAIPQRVHHVRNPGVSSLGSAQVWDAVEALRTTLFLFEGLQCTGPTHGVIARQHHRVVEGAA